MKDENGAGATKRFLVGLALVALAVPALTCRDAPESADMGSFAPEPEAGAPSLVALDVRASSPSGVPSSVALVPPFSPGTHDYYVRCASGVNALTVSMTASSGAASLVIHPSRSASLPSQIVPLRVAEGDAIVAVATDGKAMDEYWVRCLPHDFPKLMMTPHADVGVPALGYYLVGNATAPTGDAAYAMVLDVNGVPVWFDRARDSVFNVQALARGVISFVDPSTKHSYEVHQLKPLKTTYVSVGGTPAGEHELRVLPNGDYLVFLPTRTSGVDLTGLEIPLPDGSVESFGPNGIIDECTIQEIDPNGNVVWTWVAGDHFDPVKDMTYLEPANYVEGFGLVVQPYHCNSIDVDTNGNLLVSARHMDSIFYIEKTTGKVLWKMGGAKYTKDGATYVSVDAPFYRQHDARLQKNWKSSCSGKSGSGQISIFDDQTAAPGRARGVVFDVNVGATGCGATGANEATVAWEYDGTGSVGATGSFRTLPEGGGIIGWGTSGNLVFSEVDAKGHDLLDFYFPEGTWSYRAIKVPTTTFDLSVLRTTAGRDGRLDAGTDGSDASPIDASSADDGARDAGSVDATVDDAGVFDAGEVDAIDEIGASDGNLP